VEPKPAVCRDDDPVSILMVSKHTLMHGGQFSVIRRVLGKPVLF
jgi:hypothetical protein